ncbi:Abi family protein [Zhenhengia yiwuensis]|jgi:abortive infection bacteriophage resistance protein|uniref:Abi family protein n=1 Tax=Zhenhengia yiwuensis TaxID=2763666 RepID=A0A926EIF2_9FIRM|nr:Abi family protein [Zhenhengia yiwuensis]MBC8580154.1 Abi family protein [Zhenhengia yiwuensis]
MLDFDKPFDIENQIEFMKKYVVFSRKERMRRLLTYTGYFRLSRYGKYLLSYTSVLKTKPKQDLLFAVYDFDAELRKLLFSYCKKAEIQFKSHLSNAISLKVGDSLFYLDCTSYTPSRSEKDSTKRTSNVKYFDKFIKTISENEKQLRRNVHKYPELKEYRTGGKRAKKKIPSWAAFSYFEFGTITKLYSYLRGDLRKVVLIYGYSKKNYGKEVTKQMDTWLDAIRNLRNVCAHHNKLVGRTSSVVLMDKTDDSAILVSNTDLFSRIYAMKKVLKAEDGEQLKKDLRKIVNKAKFDIYIFNILPRDWEELYDRINFL